MSTFLRRRKLLQVLGGSAIADLWGCDGNASEAASATSRESLSPPEQPRVTAADRDWIVRSTAAGVIRAFHFNDPSQLGSDYAKNPKADWFFGAGSATRPTISREQYCSGGAALMFEIPSNTDAAAAGNWQCHFGSPSAPHLFGEDSEFFIQYRCRWNAAMAAISAKNQGTKFAGIEVGRPEPGQPDRSGSNELGITTQTWQASMLPILYTFLYTTDGTDMKGPAAQYAVTHPPTGPASDIDFQNQYKGGGSCLYGARLVKGDKSGCWLMPTDTWVTFKYHVQILRRRMEAPYNGRWWDIRVKLFVAMPGEASKLILNWGPGARGYGPNFCGLPAENQKFGKFRLMPYITSKDASVAHATGKVWCDELIISTRDIGDPAIERVATSAGDGKAYPAWREGKTVGQLYAIPGTSNLGGFRLEPNNTDLVNGWIGYADDEANSRWYMVTAGGHAQACRQSWQNPVARFDFWSDTPRWTLIDPGSQYSDVRFDRYYRDGRPQARHTYDKGRYIGPGKMADGKERVVLVSGSAGWAQNWASLGSCGNTADAGPWAAGPGFDAFRLDRAGWFAHDTFNGAVHGWELPGHCPDVPAWNGSSAGEMGVTIAQDPVTHDLWVGGSGAINDRALYKWTALTNRWSGPLVRMSTTPNFRAALGAPCVFDRVRRRIVTVWVHDGAPRLVCTSASSPYPTTTIALSGHDGMVVSSCNVVHDLDSDRYLILTLSTPGPDYNWPQQLWSIDPSNGQCARIGSIPDGHVGNCNRFSYLPELHCVVWLAGQHQAIQFMPTA
jgi:hypothetical protein